MFTWIKKRREREEKIYQEHIQLFLQKIDQINFENKTKLGDETIPPVDEMAINSEQAREAAKRDYENFMQGKNPIEFKGQSIYIDDIQSYWLDKEGMVSIESLDKKKKTLIEEFLKLEKEAYQEAKSKIKDEEQKKREEAQINIQSRPPSRWQRWVSRTFRRPRSKKDEELITQQRNQMTEALLSEAEKEEGQGQGQGEQRQLSEEDKKDITNKYGL